MVIPSVNKKSGDFFVVLLLYCRGCLSWDIRLYISAQKICEKYFKENLLENAWQNRTASGIILNCDYAWNVHQNSWNAAKTLKNRTFSHQTAIPCGAGKFRKNRFFTNIKSVMRTNLCSQNGFISLFYAKPHINQLKNIPKKENFNGRENY